MASAVNSTVNTNNEFNQALGKQKGGALDKDAFMLLLVTQFKYQDPLNPMEDKDFIAQLSQFSSLEQLMNLNDGMSNLTNASLSQQMSNATSYIGKNVDASGTNISKVTDEKTQKATISSFRYAIGQEAPKGQINIYKVDDDGHTELVNSYALPARTAGTYTFDWDGETALNGPAKDGIYRVVPVFYDVDGNTITDYDAVVDGKVNGVISEGGVTYLTLDDERTVALANVRRVSEPKAASGGSGSGDDSGTGGGTGGGTTPPPAPAP